MIKLEKKIACPRCRTKLPQVKNSGKCPSCGFEFRKSDGIWHFLALVVEETDKSAKAYEAMHKKKFGGPNDGSYQILASIARGNETLDIACGEGIIERLVPETVGLEFSLNALKKAKKSGAKNLVLADAHSLPFADNSFDLAICAGSLEHFFNPQKAIKEMVRVSKIQILTVHRPLLFSKLYSFLPKLMIKNQPIEQPISLRKLETMLKKAGSRVIFKGVWTLPVNYGGVIKFLPEFRNIPSCNFTIAIKK